MRQIIFIMLLVMSNLVNAEPIYKNVDKNGNITFTDKLTDKAEIIEVKKNNIKGLLVTVTSKAKTRSMVRDVGTISFNNNKKYTLPGFLYSLRKYLEEYEGISLTFKIEDIPYAEIDDYNKVTLFALMSDLDRKYPIKVKQSAKKIAILRDW